MRHTKLFVGLLGMALFLTTLLPFSQVSAAVTTPARTGIVNFSLTDLPSSQIGLGASNQVFLKFKVTTEKDIDVQQLRFKLTARSSGADYRQDDKDLLGLTSPNFDSIKLIDTNNGYTIFDAVNLSMSGSDVEQTVTLYGNNWLQKAGTTRELALVMNIKDNKALNNQTFSASLISPWKYSNVAIKDHATGKPVINIVPAYDLQGPIMTVKGSGLLVSRATSPGISTAVQKEKNHPGGGFNFIAGSISDIKVNSIILTCYTEGEDSDSVYTAGTDGNTMLGDLVSRFYLYKNEVTPENLLAVDDSINSTTGQVDFSNLNWLISAGQTQKLIWAADISGGITANVKFACDVNAANNVVAVDNMGKAVTPTTNGSAWSAPNGCGDQTCNSPFVYVTVYTAGTLTIGDSNNPVYDQITTAQNSNFVKLARFNFVADIDSFSIKNLAVRLDTTTYPGSQYAINQVKIKYPTSSPDNLNEEQVVNLTNDVNQGSNAANYVIAAFQGLNYAVAKGSIGADFEIWATFNPIDPANPLFSSGVPVKFSFYEGVDGSPTFVAVGAEDIVTGSDNLTGNAEGNTTALYKAMPSFAHTFAEGKFGCPTSFNSTMPMGSGSVAYCFKVTPNNGPVGLKYMRFSLTSSNMDTGITGFGGTGDYNWKLYSAINGNTELSSTPLNTNTDSNYSYNVVTINFANEKIIDSETIFVLKGNFLKSSGSNLTYAVSVKIPSADVVSPFNSANTPLGNTAAFLTTAGSNLVWTDRSAVNHSLTTTDWWNGYKLLSLPTFSQNFSN